MADRLNIVVTSRTEVSSGTSRSGKDWTLYLLEATDPSGAPLNLDGKLKTFDDLPEGREVSVELERNDDPKYGVEYMARSKGSTGGSAIPRQVADLRDRVDALEARVEHLMAGAYARGEARQDDPPAPAPEPEAAPQLLPGQSPGGSFANDDDIPF